MSGWARVSVRLSLVLPPLLDPTGQPYSSLPCADDPASWDEDSPADVKRAAARICRNCPAILPCAKRRVELGHHASGVWAGHVLRSVSTDDDWIAPEVDPVLIEWAESAGVALISPTTNGKAPRR